MAEKQDVHDEVEHDADAPEVELDDNDSDFDIEIVDDVDPEDKPRRPEDAKPEIPDDDDLESYSESVQKRLKKLTFEAREAARQQAEAQRLRDEAVQYAQRLHAENQRLQQVSTKGTEYAISQAKAAAEAQIANAEAKYKTAYEAGDSEALIAAQRDLNTAQYNLARVQNYRPPAPQPQPQPQYQPQPQPQPQQLNERQKAWLERNDWYGTNPEMTGAALGVHERLVKSGVDPDSETYYNQIDEVMRRRFPDEFSDVGEEVKPPARKAQTVVAPAARAAKSPRRIKLTSTQAALAKRLGLTPQQYAAQLLKEQGNG